MDASLSRLVLFAETPRGGPHGHRVLVPAEAQVPQALLAEFLAAVQGDVVWGENFLGVSRAASQKIGTAVRQGREVLVLAGVDVTQLSRAKQKDLEQRLRELLEQLDDLVLRGVDWSHHPSSEIVIRRAEMGEWLKELETRLSLPTRPWQEGPVLLEAQGAGSTEELTAHAGTGERGCWRHVMRAAVLLLLLITGLGILFLGRLQQRSQRSAVHDEPSVTSTHYEDSVREKIQKLAEEWRCEPDQVCHSLLRAANWDRRKEAITLEAALRDGNVKSLLEKLDGKNGVQRYLVSLSNDSDKDFLRFVVSVITDDPEKVRQIRVWLYDAWIKWDNLHKQLENWQQFLERVSQLPEAKKTVIDDVILEIARCGTDEGLGDGFQEPVTPLFDRQDVMIWSLLKQFHQIIKDQGLLSNDTSTSLEAFLKTIKEGDEIVREIASQRELVVAAVTKDEEQKIRRDIFPAFDSFITHLRRFPYP